MPSPYAPLAGIRWANLLLFGLLVMVQADLWLGKHGLFYLGNLKRELQTAQAENQQRIERNALAVAQLKDLKEGLEMVEDRARAELGMIKADEILVKFGHRVQAPATTLSTAPGVPAATASRAAAP